jgi:methionyl-tRNA formyltransferase
MHKIDTHIRGLFDVPIAYSLYDGLRIKILNAVKYPDTKAKPGEIVSINKDGILVGCSDGSILLKQIQLPSKKPLFIKELINGKHFFKIGSFFL